MSTNHISDKRLISRAYKEPQKQYEKQGLPGGSAVKNQTANAGDKGQIPNPGESHMPCSS